MFIIKKNIFTFFTTSLKQPASYYGRRLPKSRSSYFVKIILKLNLQPTDFEILYPDSPWVCLWVFKCNQVCSSGGATCIIS